MSFGEAEELNVLARLKKELPEHFSVFHSVQWNLRQGKFLHARETDFVVVNSNGRCLLIEQKMGALVEQAGYLYKEYVGGEIKDVAEQIHHCRDGIRQQFKKQNRGKDLRLDYLLFCPQHHVKKVSATALERDNIVDSQNKHRLSQIIVERLGGVADQGNETGNLIIKFFKQSMALVPDVSSMQARYEDRFVELSGQALEIVESIKMRPLRLRLNGTAGSGKTQIALSFVRQAVESGKKPLFVCYNHSLKDHFHTLLEGQVPVKTMHGLVHEFCSREDSGIDYTPGNRTNDEWRALIDEVILSTTEQHQEFDFLVVDEGQDLGREGFEFLRLFLEKQADILWLEDLHQNLGQSLGRPFDNEGFVGLTLNRNYRSPLSIQSLIDQVFPGRALPGNAMHGLGVGRYGYQKPDAQISIVEDLVQKHLDSGVSAGDIAIVSLKGVASSAFSNVDNIAGIPVRRFTGGYENDKQIYSKGKITFETIRRFKGQQAPFTILVDVDPNPKSSWSMNALFCGMTRATLRLDLVGNSKNSFNRKTLGIGN